MPPEYLYQLIALVLLIAAALFLFIIPDHKKKKALDRQLGALSSGDRVYTKNGLRGTVVRVEGELVTVACEPSGVQLELARWGIVRTEPSEKA